MSAVDEYVRRIGFEWPPSELGFDTTTEPKDAWTDSREPRAMRASDFGHWTPEGRESLSRILRRVLVANGRRKP